jgi:predicted transcriptional regulator
LICLESLDSIDNLEEPQKIRKLIESAEIKTIIEFIKKNEGTTSDKVVKELKQEGISSRITTLSAIQTLIQLGIIIDDRKGRYSHRLKYNENYDFYDLAAQLLIAEVEEVKDAIYKLSKDDDGVKLIHEIGDYIVRAKSKRKQLKIYPQEQRVQMIEGIPATPGLRSHSAAIPRNEGYAVRTKAKSKRKSKKPVN